MTQLSYQEKMDQNIQNNMRFVWDFINHWYNDRSKVNWFTIPVDEDYWYEDVKGEIKKYYELFWKIKLAEKDNKMWLKVIRFFMANPHVIKGVYIQWLQLHGIIPPPVVTSYAQ